MATYIFVSLIEWWHDASDKQRFVLINIDIAEFGLSSYIIRIEMYTIYPLSLELSSSYRSTLGLTLGPGSGSGYGARRMALSYLESAQSPESYRFSPQDRFVVCVSPINITFCTFVLTRLFSCNIMFCLYGTGCSISFHYSCSQNTELVCQPSVTPRI